MGQRCAGVLIVGGGIGGLALGIALRRRGIEATIVEKAPQALTGGSGLVLAPNGVGALDRIDPALGRALRKVGRPRAASLPPTLLDPEGQPSPWSPYGGGGDSSEAPTVPVMRADLLRLLSTAAAGAGVSIHYGAPVAGIEQAVDHALVRLVDGGSMRSELVVGADGLRSIVRASIVDDGPPRYVGLTSVRGVSPIPDRLGEGFITFGQDAQFFTAPVSSEQLYWVATMPAEPRCWPSKSPRQALVDLTTYLDGWHHPIPQVLATCDPHQVVVTDVCDRDPVATWSDRHVALLGDAAHPMAPTMGQGANSALEDADCLATCLPNTTSWHPRSTPTNSDASHRRTTSLPSHAASPP